MWLLIFTCMSTVGGVPISPTKQPTTHTPVGGIQSNNTLNATTPAPSTLATMLEPPQLASGETLEELHNDKIVQEGDILMLEDRNAVQTLWPDATVPFTISAELASEEATIYAAFKMISDVTCISFKPHTTEFSYLKFKSGNGCASFVGCQGGAQSIYHSRSCSVGNLCHELIHALGLHHEHNRKDRDQYITVQWQSITPGTEKNFKIRNGNTLNMPYDIDSIMHYGQYFFSVNGSPTLMAKYGGANMGQRRHLSPMDVQKVNRLYHCGGAKPTDCLLYTVPEWNIPFMYLTESQTLNVHSAFKGTEKNFKIRNGNTLNMPYDIDSIMHYGQYFFSVNGSPTLMAKYGGANMGQRRHLSPMDVQKVNRLYHCDERGRW